jgi:hypothetical protein
MAKFIEKLGMDKVAHFGIGGLITALVTIALIGQDLDILVLSPWRMLLYPFAGVVVTAFVSVIKEVFFDEMRDWKDLWAALAGCAMVFIAVFVGVLFFYGNK